MASHAHSLSSGAFSLGNRVGLLGGGQLARMLAESAFRLGLQPIVLAHSAQDPAAQLCPGAVFGSTSDPVSLRRLFSQVDLVTFENEFVPCELLEEAGRGTGVRFVPELGAVFQLQDKLRQKELLGRLKIPTSPFLMMERDASARGWLAEVENTFGGRYVLKWAQLGYDGKGTFVAGEDAGACREEALNFISAALAKRVPLYAEQKVAFRRELAVVASHSVNGEFTAYPLVISNQRAGICRSVSGPAVALGVDPALEAKAHRYARLLAESLPIHGTFAVEAFETPDGDLWVNELAPRVHNTGHYSQDASRTSQFENHWRAILGLPLGDVTSAPGFAMLNLLGREGVIGDGGDGDAKVTAPVPSERAHLHWYGKSELRPGRKLGHLNGAVASSDEVAGLLRELEACESDWWEKVQAK